eukprot:6213586-Pleurochrysis_carterae.AAC.3
MSGWTVLCTWGHPVPILPVTNGTIRHIRRMTEVLRINSSRLSKPAIVHRIAKSFNECLLPSCILVHRVDWRPRR